MLTLLVPVMWRWPRGIDGQAITTPHCAWPRHITGQGTEL